MKNDLALKVENISKCYRIGLKETMHDSLGVSLYHFLKSPLQNYRNYRGLYQFDNQSPELIGSQPDVIWAVRDISFEVKEGEVVGIIGGNGAGKSTLLKILSKITTPTSGRATVRGKISCLLEVGTGFHPELTGRENVFLNGTILGMRKKEIDRKFDEIVDFSGVEKFIDTPVKRYSSGMKVRLAFAVAAHLEPDILIVDEVLAVGDAAFQKKCLDKMKDVGQHGRTVLFVSHNMAAVSRLCERAILLNGGRFQFDGPTHEVLSRYLNSETGARAEYKWVDLEDAPGDEVVRLCAVRVRGSDGFVSDTLDISQPIRIEIEYQVLKPGYEFRVYYHVFHEEGVEAFVSIDNDPAWLKKPRKVGRYVSTSVIPGDLLAEGRYFIGPSIGTKCPEVKRLGVQDAVVFHVIEKDMNENGARGDSHGHLPGVVRPLLKWETQFSAKEAHVEKTEV